MPDNADANSAPFAICLDPKPSLKIERPVDLEFYGAALERDRLAGDEAITATLAAQPAPPIVKPLPEGARFAEDARFLLSLGLDVGAIDCDLNIIPQKGNFDEPLWFPRSNWPMRISLMCNENRFGGLCFDSRMTCSVEGLDVFPGAHLEEKFRPTLRKLSTDGLTSKRFYRIPVLFEGCAPRTFNFYNYEIKVGNLFEPISGEGEWKWMKTGNDQFSSCPTWVRDALSASY